jgi:uncharacterized protein (TIGR00255 family)
MTGFGRAAGEQDQLGWAWELRSVNARGLDLRLRLPPGFDALEPPLREAAGRHVKRGSLTANLTVRRAAAATLAVDEPALEAVLRLALDVARRIPDAPAPRAETLLAIPGVLRSAAPEEEGAAGHGPAILRGFEEALAALLAMRRAEGGRLTAVLAGLLDEITILHATATMEAADQPALQRARLLLSVQALLHEAPPLPEERIVQEVALLAARSDVREELDRLASHIAAAHALLAETTPIGRRFDFLVQEFAREANTLCSKSASAALTATGLRLKVAIEQLREQVQNIE